MGSASSNAAPPPEPCKTTPGAAHYPSPYREHAKKSAQKRSAQHPDISPRLLDIIKALLFIYIIVYAPLGSYSRTLFTRFFLQYCCTEFLFIVFIQDAPLHLHTPHVPPSLLQCLQYLQFLQAEQLLVPEQVPSASVLPQHDCAKRGF